MKILKEGRDQKGWAKEFECTGAGNGDGGCGSMFLVEEDDLFQTKNCDYTGDCETYTTFVCMKCGVLTDLPRYGVGAYPHTHKLVSYKAWKEKHEISSSV